MNIDQPQPEEAEMLYNEVVVSNHQNLDVAEKTVHEYHELEACKNSKGGNIESHTYEAALVERANGDAKESGVFSQARKADAQTNGNYQENAGDVIRSKKVFDASQYNVFDHSIVSNPAQKAIVETVYEESLIEGQCYNKPQAHNHSLVCSSSEDLVNLFTIQAGNKGQREESPHVYQKLDHGNFQAPAPLKTALNNPMESTGDYEYHVLEEATTTQQNEDISGPFSAFDTGTSVKPGTSSEQLLSESTQSPVVVFDDPLYSSFPNDMKTTEEQSGNANGSDVNKLDTMSEGKPLISNVGHHDSVSSASHDQLLPECGRNRSTLFDDPLYSMLPPDKISTATPSQVKVDGSDGDEQCQSTDTGNTSLFQ